MKAWLQLNGLWRLVSGSEKKPADKPEVLDSKGTVLTAAVPPDEEKLERWEIKAERACGALKTAISHELRVLIRDCEDPSPDLGHSEGLLCATEDCPSLQCLSHTLFHPTGCFRVPRLTH